MSAKGLMSLAVVVLSTVAGAETYTWTGAQNGFWTNAANWTVGGEVATKCPGVCSNEIFAADGSTNVGWTTQVALADLAEFSTVADGKATTIDLDGHYCVSSVVFRAGCPRYTLGTSGDQVIAFQALGIWADNSVSKFTVEKGAAMPVFVAGFSVGFVQKSLQHSTSSSNTKLEWGYAQIENKTAETMTFSSFGLSRNPGNTTVPHIQTYFVGTGGYRFEGPYRDMGYYGTTRQNSYFSFQQSGKVTFATPQFGRGRDWNGTRDPENYHGLLKIFFDGSCSEMEICEGCRVSLSDWNEPTLGFETDVRIYGGGTLQTGIQSTKPLATNYGAVYVRKGKTVTVETAFDVNDSSGKTKTLRFNAPSNASNYQGTFFFDGPTNGVNGFIMFRAPMTYKARRTVDFGLGDLALFETDGTFEYVGDTEETFSRRCIVYKDKTAIVKNSGTCPVTVTSVISPSNDVSGTSFCLQPMTAPVVFAGSFTGTGDNASTLVIAGDGVAQVAAQENLANVKAIRLTGGVFDPSTLADGDAVELTVPVTFDGGEARVAVPDGKTLTLASLAATVGKTAGTLNFLCGTGRAKVSGKSSGDAMPAGVLVNGSPAVFMDDGTLNAVPPAFDTAIAARGDVVPNDAEKVVAIMTDGEGGNDTLAEDATAAKALYHYAGADATVEIGEGRSLSVGLLSLCGLSGDLFVGTDGDLGTVSGGADGILQLANDNELRTLNVRAEVASGTDVRVDGNLGALTLSGGLSDGAALHMSDGAVTLTGERTFNLSGTVVGTNASDALTATLTLDGASAVVDGTPFSVGCDWGPLVSGSKAIGRCIVTNSFICSANVQDTKYELDTTNDAVCVGVWNDGVLEIRDGAVISNRLIVGGTYQTTTHTRCYSHGAVLQEGGEMAALGNNDVFGSHIGCTDGMGSYELAGGRFVMLGSLSVGNYGCGSFTQKGGVSVFTNNPALTSKATMGPACSANGSYGFMRFIGGRSEIRANVVLCGGSTNGGHAYLTVEDEAVVDAADNTVKLSGTHSSTGSGAYVKPADIVLSGNGFLRAAGFFTGYNSSAPDYRQPNSVGFDGGTFATGSNDRDIARASVASTTRAMTNFVVYAGGMTIDTEGKTGNFSSVPIRGAFGGGVVDLPASYKSVRGGFVAAPFVVISGDGVGATAVADFDTKSGTVTGLRILTPGVGYTTATAHYYKDSGYQDADGSWEAKALTIGANQNTGSFTKKGEGDFTLGAANTWGGDTILKGGILRLGVTGALPEGSKVVYDGGTLAVADGVELPATLNVEVPNLAEGKKVSLLAFEGTVPATLPTVVCRGLDMNKWKFALYGRTLKLAPVCGAVLIVR